MNTVITKKSETKDRIGALAVLIFGTAIMGTTFATASSIPTSEPEPQVTISESASSDEGSVWQDINANATGKSIGSVPTVNK